MSDMALVLDEGLDLRLSSASLLLLDPTSSAESPVRRKNCQPASHCHQHKECRGREGEDGREEKPLSEEVDAKQREEDDCGTA